jgi:phage-related protein
VPSIADAYVDLHVNGDNIEPETTEAIKGASPKAEKESERLGDRSGDKAGGGFVKGFRKRIGRGDSFLSAFKAEGTRAASGFIGNFRKKMSSTSFGDVGKSIRESFGGLSGLKLPAIGAAIPFITSGLSALAGAATALTGAVAQASGVWAAFAPVLLSVKSALLVGKLAFSGFTKAVGGDEKALASLSPNARAAAKAVTALGGSWNKVKGALQQAVFRGLNRDITDTAHKVLPVLQARLAGTGRVFNDLFKSVLRYGQSSRFLKVLNADMKGNNRILGTLSKAAVPALNGVLHLLHALQPAGNRLSGTIVNLAKNFSRWASSAKGQKGIQAFMDRAFKSATHLAHIVVNLGKVLHNVFGAATKPGDALLKVFDRLTGRLADFTGKASTKNAIAEWAKKGIKVSGQLARDLGKIGKVLLPLFNPNIASGYLSVFEGIAPIVVSLVHVFQDALAPVLKDIGKSFSENGPKFAALFTALKPLLGGVLAVVGQIITQSISMLGTIAQVITPVVAVISNVLGPVLKKFAPIIAFMILAFTNWGGAIVKAIPFVGKFLAPIVRLAEYISQKLIPVFETIGKFVGPTMKLVGKAISGGSEVAGKAFSKWFGPMLRLAEKVTGGIWKAVKFVFSKLEPFIRPVLTVVAKVVEKYLAVYRKVFEVSFKASMKVVQVAIRVIRAVVGAGARFIKSVIGTELQAARAVFSRVFGGVVKTVRGAWKAIVGAVRGGAREVATLVTNLIGNLLQLGGRFLNVGKTLGRKIVEGIKEGVRALGHGLGDLAAQLKSAINNIIGLPRDFSFSVLGKHVGFTIPGFATGGKMPWDGVARVGEHGPETVYLPRDSRVDNASKTRAADRPRETQRGPRRLVLRVGSREFDAYLDERIEAYDSLVG